MLWRRRALDRQLAEHEYVAGDEYSIADMAIFPWYGQVALGEAYGDAATFLSLKDYRHFNRWVDEVAAGLGPAEGAAWLAGRTAGVWPDEQGFAAAWRRERRFEPALDTTTRWRKLKTWRSAVQRTLGRL